MKNLTRTAWYQPSSSLQYMLWSGGASWRDGRGHWLYWSIQEGRVVEWILPGTENRYWRVLENFYKQMDAEGDGVIFQQDGAVSHWSKLTKKWYSDHESHPLPPSKFPNLSPIESIWHELKKLIWGLPHPPNTTKQLIAAIHDAWDTPPIADVDKHVNWMSDHVDALIAAKGGHMRF